MDNLAKYNAKELKPIIEHAKLIAKEKASKTPRFIAIAGCSSVGKSYLAQELGKLLEQEGIKVAILKFDDFLNPDLFDPNHFHPHLDYKAAHEAIQKIISGAKSIKKPAWNPRNLRPPAKTEEDFSVENVDIILFEGEFALCNDEPYDFRRYAEFGIFIDAEDNDILQWDWIRDRTKSETSQEEFITNGKLRLQKYRKYVRSSRDTALYLLLKDGNFRYRLAIQRPH